MATQLYKWLLICSVSITMSGYVKAAPFPQLHLLSESVHPFYISVSEVNHNVQDKTLEISCKFFADDFEETLKKNYKSAIDLSLEKDKALLDKFIPDYIGKHFLLSVNGKAVKLTYVGYEKEKESAYCYFQVENIASVKTLALTNSLLHDYNKSQINIVHVTVGGKRQSTKLDYPATQANFSF